MSVARSVTVENQYKGYTIPQEATALINVWAIQHDPKDYDHPDDFDPERFMRNPLGTTHPENPDEGRMPLYAFGAGRRACPGDKFAMDAIKLAFAHVMRSYDIVADEEVDLSVETAFDSAFLLIPKPFKVRIVPRSEGVKVVVREQCLTANELLAKMMG